MEEEPIRQSHPGLRSIREALACGGSRRMLKGFRLLKRLCCATAVLGARKDFLKGQVVDDFSGRNSIYCS
jgi:hypothetical protein